MAKERLSRDPSTSPGAFRQFLHWLDDGTDSRGEKYLEMRRRLVAYFDRKNCVAPDDLADETLNRVARRLEEEAGAITGTAPAQYCYITAKFVFLEYLREGARSQTSLSEMSPGEADAVLGAASVAYVEVQSKERLSACLEDCLARLAPADRDLILDYYQGEQRSKIEGRRVLATRLHLSVNALSIKACRIRNKLEVCVRERSGQA
jgi:DNA-directed RNA polymerase specialized sigma24 family protein